MAKVKTIPTFRNLFKTAWSTYVSNWLLLLGVAATVAVPSALLNWLGGTQEVSIFSSLAALFMNLALIWTISNLEAKTRPGVKQAYYQGTAKFIVFFLVLASLAAMLLPFVWGTSLYTTGMSSLAAISMVEKIFIALLSLLLSLPSLFWLNRYFLALFALQEEGSTPLLALRASKRLVKGRGWTVLRRNLAFMLGMILLLVLPTVVLLVSFEYSGNQVFLYMLQLITTLVFLPFSYVYWFGLYRALLAAGPAND